MCFCFLPPNLKFSTSFFLLLFFSGSFWTSDEGMGEWTTKHKVYMNHAEVGVWGGIWFAESVFETECNAGALKSVRAPGRIHSENETSICAAATVGCESHQLRPKFKSLSLFCLLRGAFHLCEICTHGWFQNRWIHFENHVTRVNHMSSSLIWPMILLQCVSLNNICQMKELGWTRVC